MTHMVDAIEDNAIDPRTLDAATLEKVVGELERRNATKARKDKKDQTPVDASVTSGERPSLRGKAVFIDQQVIIPEEDIAASKMSYRWHRTLDRCQADIFIARDPAQPGQRTQWASIMRGGIGPEKTILYQSRHVCFVHCSFRQWMKSEILAVRQAFDQGRVGHYFAITMFFYFSHDASLVVH